MKHFTLQCLLAATLGSASLTRLQARFPQNVEEAQAEAKLVARRLLKPVSRSMQVADQENADVGTPSVTVNVSAELPVRLSHFIAIREDPKEDSKNSTGAKDVEEVKDESHETRMKNSLEHGKASEERPTTPEVKDQEKKVKEAWIKYAEPPHSSQPMVAECAAMLQGARTVFAKSHCSMEFQNHLDGCLKAEPYCKFFDKDFVTSVSDIEKQADTWCGKAECENSVEELYEIEKEGMAVASENSAALLPFVKDTMPKFVPTWQKDGCFAKVCTTLQQQASQVNDAYIAYDKLGRAYASYANEVKLEGLVLYDLYQVAGCK